VRNTNGNSAVTETPHKDIDRTRKLCSKTQAQGKEDDRTMTQLQCNNVAQQQRCNNHNTNNSHQDENNANKACTRPVGQPQVDTQG
jgi:hypothetical protein